MKHLVFSGIQPNTLHIGNYLGAISQWKKLQSQHDSLFCIVDLHALTSNYTNLSSLSFQTAALYMACGLDPQNGHFFIQSHVPFHTELFWLLTSKTPFGWLSRMTQFKSSTHKDNSVGLFTYPILMAADILLYNASLVPVGADQKQHVEFTRDLAERFNSLYDQELFRLPDVVTPDLSARVMSLKDGTKKMSKSDPNPAACLFLTDTDDQIAKTIKKAKTDSLSFPTSPKHLENRPEMQNLFHLLACLNNTSLQEALKSVASCSQLKEALTQASIKTIAPIRERFLTFMGPEQHKVLDALQKGAKHAYCLAQPQYERVRSIMLKDN